MGVHLGLAAPQVPGTITLVGPPMTTAPLTPLAPPDLGPPAHMVLCLGPGGLARVATKTCASATLTTRATVTAIGTGPRLALAAGPAMTIGIVFPTARNARGVTTVTVGPAHLLPNVVGNPRGLEVTPTGLGRAAPPCHRPSAPAGHRPRLRTLPLGTLPPTLWVNPR